MKTIAIDARLYSQTGVGTYLRNLLHELSLLPLGDMRFIVYVLEGDRGQIRLPADRFEIRAAPYRWHTLAEQTAFYLLLSRDNPALVHFTYFGYPVLYKAPFIATVHDLTPLLFRTGKASTKNPILYSLKHAAFRFVLESQIKNARAIITPTVFVKKQVEERYGLTASGKVYAIPEGIGYELRQANGIESKAKRHSGPFYLYVGNFYPHKNVENLIRAYAKVRPPEKLILMGPRDHFSGIIQSLIQELGMQESIEFVHNATVTDLAYHYIHAKALIHPTLSEGFGLPLIEAAYFNLPIIASDIPVIAELLGKSYMRFDPRSCEDIAAKIKLFSEKPLKPDYGKISETYSFSSMAKSTLDLYRSVIT